MKRLPLLFCLMLSLLLLTIVAYGQQRKVTGSVMDNETVEPLAGVSITIKGTTTTVVTDSLGNFSINIPSPESVLIFSFVGFGQQEVTVGDRSSLTIRMSSTSKSLDEVVVIGYGTVKRRDLTGAVTSIKAEDIVKIPTQNVLEAIQGRVPGADITRSTGEPGAGVNIIVRGNKSITTDRDALSGRNRPLFIIDGFQGGDINTLNPSDIESIEVLKDASATAIYGAQGGNGVIIVTTKKGSSGQARISYNGYAGLNMFNYPKSRVGDDYIQLRREAGRTKGEWNSPADDPVIFDEFTGEYDALQAGQWVDWIDLATRDGIQQSHTLSISGGSAKTKVFASAGYFNETGMFRNSNYKRFSGRFNVDQTINDWAKAGILSQVTYSIQNLRNDPLSTAATTNPLGIPYSPDGMVNPYPIPGDSSRISPLADEVGNTVARDNNLTTTVSTNGYIELTPVKGLTFRSNFGANLTFNRRGIFNDKQSLARSNVGVSQASSEQNFNRYINWDNILSYNKDINDHSFTVTGISSYIQSDEDQTYAQGIGQLLSSQLFYDLSATSNNAGDRTIRTPYEGWNNLAFAGRINYSFKGKYLLTVSGRYDGASRLSEGNKWDFFPSAAIGWNISDEGFMENVSAINNLKLRASYGVSGNYNIDVYGTQSLLVSYPNMGFGDEAAPGYYFSGRVANPNLGWEKSATTNLGLDITLIDNRIDATIDAYNTVTSDILLPRPLPLSSGVVDVYQNIGETQNRGIEISISSQNIRGGDFRWSSALTFSSNRERITKLLNDKDILAASGVEDNSLLLGHPIFSFYNYKKLGIWQTSEADEAATYLFDNAPFIPGDIKVADLQPADPVTGMHVIDGENDRTYIGSAVPKWVAGFQNTFSYKAFDLGVYLFARYGQMIKAEFLGRYNPSGERNGPATIDYWTPENPTNDYPRPESGTTISNYNAYQTLSYVDGSFFKIKTLTLGFTLPENAAQRLSLSRLRIYATASNLLVAAKSHLLKDYDPERGGDESSPLGKQFVFGVNIDL